MKTKIGCSSGVIPLGRVALFQKGREKSRSFSRCMGMANGSIDSTAGRLAVTCRGFLQISQDNGETVADANSRTKAFARDLASACALFEVD